MSTNATKCVFLTKDWVQLHKKGMITSVISSFEWNPISDSHFLHIGEHVVIQRQICSWGRGDTEEAETLTATISRPRLVHTLNKNIFFVDKIGMHDVNL